MSDAHGGAGKASGEIDPLLFTKLVCPVTRTALRWDAQELVSDAAGLAFPVRDGVPVLLVREARILAGGA
ncbi:MAG: Trm112 family protein [Sphingobium sp.]